MKNQQELPFHNTIDISGDELKKAKENIGKQADRIIDIMRNNGSPMTPFLIWKIYSREYHATPITSIRRAMTDLTKKGMLEKTNEKALGMYGMMNYKWKVVD